MGRFALRKEVRLFILVYCACRVFLLFIPYSPADFLDISLTFETAVSGATFAYPILFRFQMLAFQLLFGRNLFGERLGFIIYEIGLLVVLYKFVNIFAQREFQKTRENSAALALKIMYIYSFFPQTLYIYSGSGEIYASFFMILGLYMYYREKIVPATIFIGIGFLMEIYPIFCMIPIVIRYLSKHQFKQLGILIGTLVITLIFVSLPFYLLNSVNFLTDFLVQFSRVPKAVSGWNIIYDVLPIWDLINLGGVIKISPIGVAFFTWLGAYVICSFTYYHRHKIVSKPEEYALMLTFILLLSVVFLSLHPRYIIFGFALFCLLIESRVPLPEFQKHSIKITAIIIGIAISTLILWPLLNFTTVEQSHYTFENMILYVVLLYTLYISISVVWMKFGVQIRLFSVSIERITILQLFSVILLLLLIQAVFDQVPGVSIIPNIIGIIAIIWSAQKIADRFLFSPKRFNMLYT